VGESSANVDTGCCHVGDDIPIDATRQFRLGFTLVYIRHSRRVDDPIRLQSPPQVYNGICIRQIDGVACDGTNSIAVAATAYDFYICSPITL
jgi:hypothetical protein